nr:MAG TPA: hypothetical protein [Caudoviricetes sp.]
MRRSTAMDVLLGAIYVIVFTLISPKPPPSFDGRSLPKNG